MVASGLAPRSCIEDSEFLECYWLSVPVDGTDMERYNPSFFFLLGRQVGPLNELSSEALDAWFQTGQPNSAIFYLNHFLNRRDDLIFSKGCRFSAQHLIDRIVEVKNCDTDDEGELRARYKVLREDADSFLKRFDGDCKSLDLFRIPQVQAYMTTTLLESGERLIPAPWDEKLLTYGGAAADTQNAAKCLVLKLWTAAGFHIARATEALIQEYYRSFNGGELPVKGAQKTWVSLVRTMLDQEQGDAKLLADAKIVGETYRNPLIHPEHSLDEADGPLLLSACIGVMTKLLAVLP